MSSYQKELINKELNEKNQCFMVSQERKEKFGEVNSPFSLIKQMLNSFPPEIFSNPNLKWLDPCVGCGYYPIVLYQYLNNGLREIIKNAKKRHTHIVKNMIFMCEVNEIHKFEIQKLFGKNCNLVISDFLSTTSETFGLTNEKFDIILGNPPYNANGLKKVPTNQHAKKTQDGITIWHGFIKHGLSMLKSYGFLSMIVPSIWMKPDKFQMYDLLTQHKIHKIRCFSNQQTKAMFKGQAQTPTCFFLLEKRETDNIISLYDSIREDYIPYNMGFYEPIPLLGCSIVEKVKSRIKLFGSLSVTKTSMPSKKNDFSLEKNEIFQFENISTCKLNHRTPYLVTKYSSIPCAYHGVSKLVLAHKMYGFPYYDMCGNYGICNRDNYVITGYNENEFKKLQCFLSSKLALFLFETTRYRMSYLEKYIFELIPNILIMPSVQDTCLEDMDFHFWISLFDLNQEERKHVENYHSHNYLGFDKFQYK